MKILFIYHSSLSESEINTASNRVFQKLISNIPNNKIILLLFGRNKIVNKQTWLSGYRIEYFTSLIFNKKLERIFRKTILRYIYFYLEYNIINKLFYKKIRKIIGENNVKKVWFFSSYETIALMSNYIEKFNIPFHISVHDDILENSYFDKYYSKKIKSTFIKLLRKSTSCDLISPYMENYYRAQGLINNKSINIWGGYIDNCNHKYNCINKKIIKIAFVGSISTIEEHKILWEAIADINLKREGEKIHLDYYSYKHNRNRINTKEYNFIRFNELLEEKMLIEKLKEYDLLYLVMSFNPKWQTAMELAFPSKTLVYISSFVPIIGHGPYYSSISDFIKTKQLGVFCSSLSSDDLKNKILDIEKNIDFRKEIQRNMLNIVISDLNLKNNIEKYLCTLFWNPNIR